MGIQPGTYRARGVAGATQFGVAKTGTEQIGVTFTLLDNDDQPTLETITWVGFFSEAAMPRTLEALKTCGWDIDATGYAGEPDVATNIVEIVVIAEEYEGESRIRVKWVNPIGGGKFAFAQPLDPTAKASLMSRIKAHKATTGGASAPRPAKKPAAPARYAPDPDPANGEELPF